MAYLLGYLVFLKKKLSKCGSMVLFPRNVLLYQVRPSEPLLFNLFIDNILLFDHNCQVSCSLMTARYLIAYLSLILIIVRFKVTSSLLVIFVNRCKCKFRPINVGFRHSMVLIMVLIILISSNSAV